MSELPEKTQRLVRILREQTESGRREWEKASSDTEFIFVHGAGSVIVSSVDGDGAAPYELRVLDTAGSLVERYDSGDTGSDGLYELYETARRSSVKPSAVVETLLDQLDDIPF